MIVSTLTAYCETDAPVFRPVRCLEGLGATGVCGLTWAKHLDAKVTVTVNAVSERAAQRIQENAERNSLKINVTTLDSRMVLQQKPYSFIVLESFANSSAYLDSALVYLPRGGVLVLSTTDDPALYCKVPEVALRKYGGRLGKTKYYREMAARLIVASVARSAARYDKGVRVLWCFSNKGHLTVVIQVDRGPVKANESLTHIRELLHCNICEERTFLPDLSGFAQASPYDVLRCQCRNSHPGKTALQLGPLWSGELYDPEFLRLMLQHCPVCADTNTKETLDRLLEEALCSVTSEVPEEPPNKKPKIPFTFGERSISPAFYFNIHKNGPKDAKLLRADRVVTCLRSSGFRASRTHFDPEAVRTNASLRQFQTILQCGFLPHIEERNSAEF